MIYVCIKKAPGLTVGKQYIEWAVHPCPFNAIVKNDKGEYRHYARKEYFDDKNNKD